MILSAISPSEKARIYPARLMKRSLIDLTINRKADELTSKFNEVEPNKSFLVRKFSIEFWWRKRNLSKFFLGKKMKIFLFAENIVRAKSRISWSTNLESTFCSFLFSSLFMFDTRKSAALSRLFSFLSSCAIYLFAAESVGCSSGKTFFLFIPSSMISDRSFFRESILPE